MNPHPFLDRYISGQYRRPSGIVGRYIGGLMVKQHAPENGWTVDLLQAQAGNRILEIGFGGGYAIQQLAQVVTQGRLAGVDFSPTMVAATRRRNAAAVAAGRVDLRQADAGKLPYTDSEFDKAYSIHSIYFWREPELALRDIWRVLKPGGLLVLTLQPKSHPGEKGTPDFIPYSGEELEAMLRDAGFRETRIEDGRTTSHRSNYSVIALS
jgi:SAM-dependent methyltransferase